jgi:hypothetical protein
VVWCGGGVVCVVVVLCFGVLVLAALFPRSRQPYHFACLLLHDRLYWLLLCCCVS